MTGAGVTGAGVGSGVGSTVGGEVGGVTGASVAGSGVGGTGVTGAGVGSSAPQMKACAAAATEEAEMSAELSIPGTTRSKLYKYVSVFFVVDGIRFEKGKEEEEEEEEVGDDEDIIWLGCRQLLLVRTYVPQYRG